VCVCVCVCVGVLCVLCCTVLCAVEKTGQFGPCNTGRACTVLYCAGVCCVVRACAVLYGRVLCCTGVIDYRSEAAKSLRPELCSNLKRGASQLRVVRTNQIKAERR